MFDKLKQLLTSIAENEEQQRDPHRLIKLASVALMIETSRSDQQQDASEMEVIKDIATKALDLSVEDIDSFIDEALEKADSSTSLYEFTDLVTKHLGKTERIELIENLWRVAFADGKVDHYEDHIIRKIADLIYVKHSEFIQAKHRIAESL